MDSGFKEAVTVEEPIWILSQKQFIMDNGNSTRKKGKVGLKSHLNNTILEYLAKERRMDLVLSNFQMETNIVDNIKKGNFMDEDVIAGRMVLVIKEISLKGLDKDQEAGIHHKKLIFTLEAIKEIIKVDTVDIFLEADAFMKDSLIMTQEMGRED